MSKIFAISSTGKSEKSFLDLRFGKCENVVFYNAAKKEYNIIENPFKNSANSGIELVKFLKKEGVSVIITGEVGPQVSDLLAKERLQLVLLHEEKIKVEDVIDRIGSKR
ncbi:MAG: NifB/NifX family molybdenum-iron cluster-binding protein [Bacteroidota bacterium]